MEREKERERNQNALYTGTKLSKNKFNLKTEYKIKNKVHMFFIIPNT